MTKSGRESPCAQDVRNEDGAAPNLRGLSEYFPELVFLGFRLSDPWAVRCFRFGGSEGFLSELLPLLFVREFSFGLTEGCCSGIFLWFVIK